MKHYGDITKINGAEAPIVDVICGGSPCQDLSVAGKRAGLDGERSGLFMEQIRIVKEQRNECIRQLQLRGADVDLRYVKPRYMVWENVPGAFSSNKGEDFRCVLEEICRIADKTATVPLPENGKWSNSGTIVGDGWSVAWRVHDSQFWGVPQRRRRIALVADFGSESAPEILFERESLSGDINPCGEKGEEVAGTIKDSTNKAISFQERGGCPGGGKGILIQDEKTASLRTQQNQSVCYGLEISPTLRSNMGDNQVGVACYGMDNERRRGPEEHEDQSPTITAKCGTGGNNVPVVIEGNGSRPSHNGDGYKESEISYTLNSTEVHGVCADTYQKTTDYKDAQVVASFYPQMKAESQCYREDDISNTLVNGTNPGFHNGIVVSGEKVSGQKESELWDGTQTAPTLTANNADGSQRMPDKENFNAVITYGLDRASFNQGKNAQYDFSVEEEKAQTLVAKGPGGGY